MARASFFDAQLGIHLYDIPLTGEATRSIALKEVNVVVGNPPYIRQENIASEDKSNFAELFRTEWPGQTMLSGRSDIYAYFFTHAAKLLKPGGYLGFVTSIGRLDTEYGFKLQEFFLRNFRIIAVIESQVEKWFEDARVTTAVTILRRECNAAKRDDNPVRFIQLRKPLAEIYATALGRPSDDEATRQADMDVVRDLIEGIREPQTPTIGVCGSESRRSCGQRGSHQGGRRGERRHSRSIQGWQMGAVRPRFRFMVRAYRARSGSHDTLRDLAEISRGFTSGADRFFCVRDVTQLHLKTILDPQEFHNRWGISRRTLDAYA